MWAIDKVLEKPRRARSPAACLPPGSNGLLSTPWVWGEAARAGLFNLSLGTTRDDIVRAFLEGVALNTRWLLGPVQRSSVNR